MNANQQIVISDQKWSIYSIRRLCGIHPKQFSCTNWEFYTAALEQHPWPLISFFGHLQDLEFYMQEKTNTLLDGASCTCTNELQWVHFKISSIFDKGNNKSGAINAYVHGNFIESPPKKKKNHIQCIRLLWGLGEVVGRQPYPQFLRGLFFFPFFFLFLFLDR